MCGKFTTVLWQPEIDHYRGELVEWLRDRLPHDQFRVLVLMFGLDGAGSKTYRQVSVMLGISTIAVKRRRHEAIDALRHYQELAEMLRAVAASQAVGGRVHATSHE